MSIVNRKYKFIYLKSHKTASSSVENYLIRYTDLGNDIYFTSKEILKEGIPRSKKNRNLISGSSKYWVESDYNIGKPFSIPGENRLFPLLFQHDHARRVQKLVGNKFWDASFKITSIRNPWDALVSFYKFEVSGQLGRVAPIQTPWDNWLEDVMELKDGKSYSRAQEYLFYPYLFIDNELVVDDVVYFEDIAGSLARVSKKLKLHFADFNEMNIHLKRNRLQNDYRSDFSNEQQSAVENHFSKYLSHFPYRFDDISCIPEI